MFLLCSCRLWLPGAHICNHKLTWVRHKDGWPDSYPHCRGGRGMSQWLSINFPVPPTWNHTVLALAPVSKTAYSIWLSYSKMTALQMKHHDRVKPPHMEWEKCQAERNIWIPEVRDERPCLEGNNRPIKHSWAPVSTCGARFVQLTSIRDTRLHQLTASATNI